MYETEEFSEGVWIIHRPDGKVVGKLSVVDLAGGGRQEDWYLVTTVPPGVSNHAVYVWPSAQNPDVVHRYERVGGAGGAPGFPNGVAYDQYRHTPAKI